MDIGRYVLAVLVVFAVMFGFDYMVHGVLMVEQYDATSNLWRDQTSMSMGIMALSQFLFASIFVYIFTRHYEGLGLAEGMRYGCYIGLLIAALNLGSFAYLPVPFMLVACWMIAALVSNVLLGIVTAAVYRE